MAGKRIFISYSRRDTEYVSSLADALRKQGFDVWFDENIRTGTDWDDTLEEELKKADTIILVLSKTSVKSENVKDEMNYVLNLGKVINPIKIEDCDVPMRLARKQYIDFEELGHEEGFEKLVRDITLQLTNSSDVQINKGTFVPPKTPLSPVMPETEPKLNNKLVLILGITLGVTLAIILILVLVVVFAPGTENTDGISIPYEGASANTTVEDQDWATAYNKDNLDSYINFLYTYGKTTKYYQDAYTEINKMLPKTATVWYGTKGGNYNFTKYLYYAGDQTTPPQYEDIITPLFKSELYLGEKIERSGFYVQPGTKLLVYDVWIDINNNIWVGVRYKE